MTKEVLIGGKGTTKKIIIGGNNPVSVQTMWKDGIVDVCENPSKLDSILKEINNLQMLGCDIIRFAVPDIPSAKSLCEIAARTSMPLVADIHFDYKLALECLKGNVAKIRINPGNIGSFENTKTVVEHCRDKGVAIRIGINSGSLPKDLQEEIACGKISRAQGLCETAVREAEIFDKLNFDQYIVSMKSSDVQETIECNEFYAKKYNNQLHLGVTEAGPLIGGVNILKECGIRSGGVTLVSCPRCGRIGFDVHAFVDRWQNKLLSMKKDITVAVMGCVVNGPGEGKHADIGIAGGKDKVIIFKKGQIVRTVDEKDADKVFEEELNSL